MAMQYCNVKVLQVTVYPSSAFTLSNLGIPVFSSCSQETTSTHLEIELFLCSFLMSVLKCKQPKPQTLSHLQPNHSSGQGYD